MKIFSKKHRGGIILLIANLMGSCSLVPQKNQNFLSQILEQSKDTLIQKIISKKEEHELQILYTQIQRDQEGNPIFKTYRFQENPNRYFYPASTVKFPVAILALEKIRRLQKQGVEITPDSPFQILDDDKKPLVVSDSTHPKGKLTIAHLIKKLFLVSDNQAYNYLYDFLGRDPINRSMKKKGILGFQIYHKFSKAESNDRSPEFVFFSDDGSVVYRQLPAASQKELENEMLLGYNKGKGFISDGALVSQPMDFSKKNHASLNALNETMKRVFFPNLFSKEQSFEIHEEDYDFIQYWMSRTPIEVDVPLYDRAYYYDSYCKFIMYGDLRGKMTDQIRIYNKVGLAYGTLTDVAYVRDQDGVEFFLAATLLVNQNEIFNDGQYEYDGLGIPFLGALGRAVYEFERKMPRPE